MEKEERRKLTDYALRLLSLRPRSQKEIEDRLNLYSCKHKISPQYSRDVIIELTSQNLINDEEFVSWWIEQRSLHKPKGRKALINELRRKGIKSNVVENVLSETKYDGKKEYDLALQAVEKKLTLWRNLSVETIRRKMWYFLTSRGFQSEIIYRVMSTPNRKFRFSAK